MGRGGAGPGVGGLYKVRRGGAGRNGLKCDGTGIQYVCFTLSSIRLINDNNIYHVLPFAG